MKLPIGERLKIDSAMKLDSSNVAQMDKLFDFYSQNMATVDFWLNYCVLPVEMQQYPQRLSTSAWHLADNARGALVGFSGTNDNHRLLPLQVRQAELPDRSLVATNGKMLSIIIDNPRYMSLPSASSEVG